ncbi:hypothetical protein [Actinomadura gamaensis]|uniref:DUF1778 domain-containing protein n=1 Tax=Actinomadura gamaensis TaxID=1763541 RepID=A0ABV9TQP8_9ACTN
MPVETPLPDHLDVPATEDQFLTITRAADLLGWTVPEYVLTATLDRAERDLYENATIPSPPTLTQATLTPYTALLTPTS